MPGIPPPVTSRRNPTTLYWSRSIQLARVLNPYEHFDSHASHDARTINRTHHRNPELVVNAYRLTDSRNPGSDLPIDPIAHPIPWERRDRSVLG